MQAYIVGIKAHDCDYNQCYLEKDFVRLSSLLLLYVYKM